MAYPQQADLVVIDARRCGVRELFERYEAFGLLCAGGEVRHAMLKLGDADADAHYTLRDILVTLARIGGVRLAFSLALVAPADSTARVCQAIQVQLGALGCEARVFRLEREAQGWLSSLRSEERHRVGVTADLGVRDLA